MKTILCLSFAASKWCKKHFLLTENIYELYFTAFDLTEAYIYTYYFYSSPLFPYLYVF